MQSDNAEKYMVARKWVRVFTHRQVNKLPVSSIDHSYFMASAYYSTYPAYMLSMDFYTEIASPTRLLL